MISNETYWKNHSLNDIQKFLDTFATSRKPLQESSKLTYISDKRKHILTQVKVLGFVFQSLIYKLQSSIK